MITLSTDSDTGLRVPGVTLEPRDERTLAELFETTNGVVAVAARSVDLESVDWSAGIATLEDDTIDAVVLDTYADGPMATAWARLPPDVARLCCDPTHSAVIAFRTRAFTTIHDDPWRMLLRADAERVRFITGTAAARSDAFPQLAPPPPGRSAPWFSEFVEGFESPAVQAGLLQMHDHLEESHTLAQEAGNADGDYWHAIMHRREPDPSNSKYWWRRVGDHPVFERLVEFSAPVAGLLGIDDDRCDPFAFVDSCERTRQGGDERTKAAARRLQWCEMVLLLDHCLDR